MRPILELCERSVRRPGAWVSWRWYDQGGVGLGGERDRAGAGSYREEEKCGEEAVQEEITTRI